MLTARKLRVGTPEEVGMSPQRIQHVRELSAGWFADGVTPSLVVLAARRGVIVLHEAFGQLTPDEDSPPLAVDSLFPVTSITKPIVATAVMCLVEDGLLGLNRPVADYIPEFQGEGKGDVLVHHLLTHTSGIRQEEVDAHMSVVADTVKVPPPDDTQHPLVQERLFGALGAPLWKPPGVEMSYSDHNYTFAGEIVRRVSGDSLDNFARERIFAPLGMNDTYFIVPESVRRRAVRRPPGSPFPSWGEDRMMDIPFAATGASSTALDMATFLQMFLNRGRYGEARIVSGPTVDAMTRNQIPGIGADLMGERHAEAFWGLGWDIHGPGKWNGHPGALLPLEAFHHRGMGGTYIWGDPINEIVGAYFSVRPSEEIPLMIEEFVNAVTAAVVD
jgi:CubicO group peptidase (beta-lactamase class C family)